MTNQLTASRERFISLRTKFVVFFSLIIIATCSGLSWYFIQNKRSAMTEQLTSLGNVLVTNLAHNARYGVIIEEESILNQFIDGVMEVDEVVYVVISRSDGKVLAAQSKGLLTGKGGQARSPDYPLYPISEIARKVVSVGVNEPVMTHVRVSPDRTQLVIPPGASFLITATTAGETFYDFARAVPRARPTESTLETLGLQSEEASESSRALSARKMHGLVQVGLDETKLQQALATVIRDIILLTLFIIVAGIVGTHVLTSRIVTPLRSLATMARKVSEGELSVTVPLTTRDEIGQVAALFNIMTQSLKERDRAISANLETIQRHAAQLTTLSQASAAITSTLDLDRLLTSVLQLLLDNLGFVRMVLVLYDHDRNMATIGRVAGVSREIEQVAREMDIPVRDDGGTDAELLIHGKPILALNLETVAHRMFPPMLELVRQIGVASYVAVPLRSQQRILGYLAGDRGAQPCRQEDLDLMMTVASHVAVAIDNARAYMELEVLTQTLENRVEERTHELRTANEKLEEQDRRKTKFVSVASHELRTPMTSIRGFVDNMLDGLTGQLTERQTYYLNRVKHNVERLTRLINQLLIWSRIDAGRIELTPTHVSLPELVHDVAGSFQTMAEKEQVTLDVRTDGNLPHVLIDRDKIEQVLWNLTGNALKFTPHQGRIIIDVQAQDDGDLRVCVADTGCGIAPHEISKLFDEFSKIESTLPGSQGAQLGLFITKSYVKLHGGRIWVESQLGQGSRFCFTVPMEPLGPSLRSETGRP